MEGEGMDFEKRYNDQQRYVRELEAKNKEQGEILNTLYKDPTYQPVRDFIKKFEDGEVESKPQAREPEKVVPTVDPEVEEIKAEYKRQKAERFQKWLSDVETKEKAFVEKHPDLADQKVVGKDGKIHAFMVRHGIDDWDTAARAVLEPHYFVDAVPKAPREKPHSDEPVKGDAPKNREPEPATMEQATTLAYNKFLERTGQR